MPSVAERQGACAELGRALRAAAERLAGVREAVDRLNVFPVPDGDTGSNMLRTLQGIVAAIDDAPADCPEAATILARAALLAARGNSGVILAQILGSLARAFGQEADVGQAWLDGLRDAARRARTAVLDPKPGTILSVIEAAAAEADPEGALEAARLAEARTPEQLPVLAQAGVVDSGGAGLVVILEAMSEALGLARPAPEHPWLDAVPAPGAAVADLSASELEASGPREEQRYEVMFSLEAPELHVDALRVVWSGLGDSIVIVGDGTLWRCHVHTNDIAGAIQAGIDAGRVRDLAVTDLHEQVEEVAWVREAPGAHAVAPKETAVIAVGLGEGVARLFRSFGVAGIVAGGQGHNPSIGELADAIRDSGAKQVIILPNNANILATAQVAAGVVEGRVAVIPTVHVVQGFSALMAYDPESPLEDNETRMTEAARRVRWGEVTLAVREGGFSGGRFHAGEAIGIAGEGIVAAGATPEEALRELAGHLVGTDGEILTVIVGDQGSRERAREALAELVAATGIELEVLDGGQPIYPYLLGVE
jgi:DAK2 domain fusion protein YloV